MDVVATVEIDVDLNRRRQTREVDVVEQPGSRSLTLDNLVHVVGVPRHDRRGDQRQRGGLGALLRDRGAYRELKAWPAIAA